MTKITNPNNINDLAPESVPELPDWIPPLDTGQPSAGDINDLSDVPRTNYAARNTVIPVPYGRDRFFPRPFVITLCETTGCLLVAYALGEGEIQGYESILVDNNDILTNATGYYGLKNAGFQTGDSYGWDELAGTIVADEGRSGTGDYAARLAATAGGPQITSPRLPVPYDGATIKISGYARRDPVSLPDANAVLTVRTATVAGGTLTYQSHTNFTGDVTADTGTSGWQYLEGYWTLPAGVVEFVLHAGEANGTTGHWFWDDLHFDFVNSDGSEFDTRLMEFNLYRGEAGQGVNGMLYNALTGFSDTYDGLAYIVGRFPPGSTSGFPRVEVIYQGRKVYDPRKYNLLFDDDADPQFLTAAETVEADAIWFTDENHVQAIGDYGWTSETADPSPASTTYAELINNDDFSNNFLSRLIDVDTSKNYTVVCYVKQPSGDRQNYLMVHFEDANGDRINNTSTPLSDATGWASKGTYHYYGIVNAVLPSSWTRYTFTFGPNAGATGTIPTGAVKMAIGGLFCRDGAVGTNTTVRVADMRVFEGNLADEQYSTDSTTWAYSANPTLCFYDMITSFSGWGIYDGGVADLASYNDEIITGSIPRREIGLTITKPDTIEKWTKVFRSYMGGFIGWEAGKIRVIPNRADVEAAGVLVLDGTVNTYCDMGDQAELDFANIDDWTLEFKFKMRDTTGAVQSLVTKRETVGSGATAVGYSLHLNVNEELAVRLADGTTTITDTDTTTNFVDNEWHHIALVRDGATNDEIIVYVDGVARTPVDTSSLTGSFANTEPFRIGANGLGSQRGDVLIDEVRVWNDIRTAQEIADNLTTEIADPLTDSSLIGYWRMNELAVATTATDYSTSANNGTLSGAAQFLTTTESAVLPEGIAMHITADDIVKGSLNLRRRSLRSVPNSVAVDYRDASGAKWRTEREQTDSPRLSAGDEQRRISRISLPGIHNATQAKREATERLNWYLTDLEATVTLFDEGWELQHGSIVALTHPIGLTAKLFRVVRTTGLKGRWTVDLVEYDPAVYSSEVVSDPTVPDTNLGDPLNPPLPTGINAVEELFNYKNGNTGSRLRITYDSVNYPFFSQYLVEGYVDGQKVWQTNTQSTEVVTPPVEELVTTTAVDYVVRVYTQSPFATSAFVEQEVTIQGKLAPPSDVPTLSIVQTAADTVELSWTAATDIDIWRYEIRRGSTSDTWATATDIPETLLIDGLSTVRTGIPVGTYRFFVKAIDSVGNESTNARTVDVTLGVPQAPTGLTGFEVASEVRLAWTPPTIGFTERYRIAYDTIPESSEITLDVVDTLRFSTKDVPEGTWRFKIYAQDKNGVEAATVPSIDIEVTSDADSFLADTYDFVQDTTAEPKVVTNGSLTNFHEFVLRTDNRLLYVTNMGDVFSSSPSDFLTYNTEALANYHSSGTSTWLSETVDFGLLLTGSWNLTHDVTALAGVATVALELSTDNVSFTSFATAAKGEYRYARVRVSTTTTATAFVKSPVMSLKINVVPLEESGQGSSSTTAATVINLEREYTAVKEINAQPRDKTDGLMAVVDNIIVGPNTGIKGDGTNYLDGGDVLDLGTGDWTIEFWIRQTGTETSAATIMSKTSGGGALWNILLLEGSGFGGLNRIRVSLADGTNSGQWESAAQSIPADNNWYHVAIVANRTADTLEIYINGSVSGGTHDISSITGSLDNAASFRIFNSNGTDQFAGELDEVRIWNDVRTSTEINDNYQTELDLTQTWTGLQAYYRMNGSTSALVGATVTDDTALGGNDLTNTGAGDLTYVDPGQSNPVQKINSFDVYVFDVFGQQLLEAFQWNWKGV